MLMQYFLLEIRGNMDLIQRSQATWLSLIEKSEHLPLPISSDPLLYRRRFGCSEITKDLITSSGCENNSMLHSVEHNSYVARHTAVTRPHGHYMHRHMHIHCSDRHTAT
ncbi:hypothetical protein GDO81_029521 [Engystomops pustulosus]|uniref:Uncharacterized protein n=1 Tax=Engystomops pustulosus TaxID=76066 RepID=A0AAV6YM54_ENGPU|nr:hypothetical protein GDO81_029521 [Engystomops pustulosus]